MRIHEQQHGAVTVLKVDGPVVGVDADELKGRLLQAQSDALGRLVLDASGILLIDSKGLETLVDVADEMTKTGKALKLSAANETLRQVLELTGLAALFEHFEDANSAVRSFL